MLSKIISCGLNGINGYIVEVESYISSGLPDFDIVGLGDTAVRESKERVRAAIKNSGFEFAGRRITVNLAPANMRKEGSIYDLAIAAAILAATGQIPSDASVGRLLTGELSLDGNIKPVSGALSMAMCCRDEGYREILLPVANAGEAAVVKGIDIIPVRSLCEAAGHICGKNIIQKYDSEIGAIFDAEYANESDFADVKGQDGVKRALEVAASGSHNCIIIGSPGSGKSMLAGRLPGILPAMTFEEALEVTRIHSISGLMPYKTPLITRRPFRSPHHSITPVGMIGGGKYPKPGEISLAHNGVLFLDEVTEFSGIVLESLRQPLEDGKVNITRLNASLTFPASFTLICAANPCKCGRLYDEGGKCTCTPRQIRQFMSRISGPLLDRIDIHIESASVKYGELSANVQSEPSSVIRQRVNMARNIQNRRYRDRGIHSNSQLLPAMISEYCRIDGKSSSMLKNAFDKLNLSARAYNRILKVSRTIADMDGQNDIRAEHIAEAIQYRSLDRR